MKAPSECANFQSGEELLTAWWAWYTTLDEAALPAAEAEIARLEQELAGSRRRLLELVEKERAQLSQEAAAHPISHGVAVRTEAIGRGRTTVVGSTTPAVHRTVQGLVTLIVGNEGINGRIGRGATAAIAGAASGGVRVLSLSFGSKTAPLLNEIVIFG